MTRSYVVTEGETDAVLLGELLKPEFDTNRGEVTLVTGAGWSGADSVGRTLLLSRDLPVALVVDADGNDPTERKQFLEAMYSRYAHPSRWRVFVVAPTLESLLFRDPKVIRVLTGIEPSEAQMVRGEYEPERILQEMLGGTPLLSAMRQRLPQANLDNVRREPWVQELRDFLKRAADAAPTSAALSAA